MTRMPDREPSARDMRCDLAPECRERSGVSPRVRRASKPRRSFHGYLREGVPRGQLNEELARHRGDKPRPREYAERTVVRACRSVGVRPPGVGWQARERG